MLLKSGQQRVRGTRSAPEARTRDGIVFASKLEVELYDGMKLYMADHPTTLWWLQPRFELVPDFEVEGEGKIKGMRLTADFLVGPARVGNDAPLLPEHLVIEGKGWAQEDKFLLRRKIFLFRYRHPLRVVKTRKQLYAVLDQHFSLASS